MKRLLKNASAACLPLVLAALPAAHAQTADVSGDRPDPGANRGAPPGYWTPERFRSAKPLPMPVVKPDTPTQREDARATQPSAPPEGSDAQAPAKEPMPMIEQLYVPDAGVTSRPCAEASKSPSSHRSPKPAH
jgi:hypothetical protein